MEDDLRERAKKLVTQLSGVDDPAKRIELVEDALRDVEEEACYDAYSDGYDEGYYAGYDDGLDT